MEEDGSRTIRRSITPMRTRTGSPRPRAAQRAPVPTGGGPGLQRQAAPTVRARTTQMQADSRSSTRHIEDLRPPDRRHGSPVTRPLRSHANPSGSPSKRPPESARRRSDREAGGRASSGMRQKPESPRSDRSPASAGRLRRATSDPNPRRTGLLGYDVVSAAAVDDRNASPWARRSEIRSSATGGRPRGSRCAKARYQRGGCRAPARSREARRPEGAAGVDRPRSSETVDQRPAASSATTSGSPPVCSHWSGVNIPPCSALPSPRSGFGVWNQR